MTNPVLPGAVLGVLGGGQLGRMFTLAARRMGYRVTVFAPQDDTPAGQIAYREVRADYEDLDAVEEFARSVDVVTFEFENVPSETAAAAARHTAVRPAGSLLHITQNRAREKEALQRLGLPVAPFVHITEPEQVAAAAEVIGCQAIAKTDAWGYDGRGQRRIDDGSGLEGLWDDLGPLVLEALVPFQAEISVVGVRGLDGDVALYEPMLNHHRHHILDVSLCPAPVPAAVRERALELARQVLVGLDVVGVLCVELFLLEDGSLIVNELAPRPHNSGHLTIDAHVCCQFEQQVRAVCGLPLGSTRRVVPAAAMVNLLGDVWNAHTPDWAAALSDPDIRLHLYGKIEPRPGRKMGHLTVLADDTKTAQERAEMARTRLGTSTDD